MRRFSPREYDVIQAIISGYTTYDDIGIELGISARSVQDHLLSIYRLTGVKNMAGLVLWLAKNGYVSSK